MAISANVWNNVKEMSVAHVFVLAVMDPLANVKNATVQRIVVLQQSIVAMVSYSMLTVNPLVIVFAQLTVVNCTCGPSCGCGDQCKGGCCPRVCQECDGSTCKCEKDKCVCDKTSCCAVDS